MIRVLAQFLCDSVSILFFSIGQLCRQGGHRPATGPGGTPIAHTDLGQAAVFCASPLGKGPKVAPDWAISVTCPSLEHCLLPGLGGAGGGIGSSSPQPPAGELEGE